MKIWTTPFFVALGLCVGNSGSIANAQPKLLSDAAPQCVFSGQSRNIAVIWRNPSDAMVGAEIHTRILQTSSATVALVGESAWKRLQVLPGQTVLESVRLDFPAVKAETRFLVQWLVADSGAGFQTVQSGGATNKVMGHPSSAELTDKMPVPLLGTTEVLVYPTNLLAELKPLAGDEPLGVFDPSNQLKPLLKNLKVTFTDLENAGLENFSGRLAIIGPFSARSQMREGLAIQIKMLAKKGVAVVWLQPPLEKRGELSPSFYAVPESTNAVVIVQPELVANLAEDPQSQLNLIYFCKLALNPSPPALPDLSAQP
jgi:hypothetical protein